MARHKVQVPIETRLYWAFRDEVATADGLLFKGTRLIVSKSPRPEMVRQIHKNNLGIVKCRQRAREVLFCPGISVEIEQMVTNCSVRGLCQETTLCATEAICTTITPLQEEHWN